jgi:hypothetical protein
MSSQQRLEIRPLRDFYQIYI